MANTKRTLGSAQSTQRAATPRSVSGGGSRSAPSGLQGYSYNDFLSAANASGLMGEFSEHDLNTAQKYPEFGLSILSLKQDYHAASTPEQKLLINEAANELRKSYGNYAGGPMGSDYISEGKIPTQIDQLLDQMNSFGSFEFDTAAPTYENQYAQLQQELLDQILNREDFTWSKETDPLYSTYKKSYLREGDRAQQNALAQASVASGGRPSTYAVTAASQAGDYYAGQLNDIIPTLYQQAYDRYLNEYSMMQQDLGAVNTQEQLDYQKYLDSLSQYNTDRNFAYNQYLDDYGRLQSNLAALQSQDAVDYGRYLDQITLQQQREERDYNRQQTEAQQAFENAMAMYQIYGYVPEQYAGVLGLPAGTATADQAYNEWYMKQQAQRRASSSGGGNGGGGGDRGADTDPGDSSINDLVTAFQAGDHSDATIKALLDAGYTQSDLEANGYTGDYFKKSGTKEEDSGFGLKDLNTSAVLNLGLGPISFDTVDKLVEEGKAEVYTDGNGALSVRWVNGWSADKYKNQNRPGVSMPNIRGWLPRP